ncbi:MAG: exodeoxyribonuclease V subunit gamma, partial [Kiritimatiellia bacterium]
MSTLFQLIWSDNLEVLAKRLIQDFENNIGVDPFSKACLISGNPLRGNWLHRFFIQHAPQDRPIIANLDIQFLYPFVNDWLYAAFEKKNIHSRRPLEHPYSKQILQWRIYHILSSSSIHDFPELEYYIGCSPSHERIFKLAGTLAQLFDVYQVQRPEMLTRWEKTLLPPFDKTEAWQCRLWQLLIKQSANTYLNQFSALKSSDFNLKDAFKNGIPQYRSIHVFGVINIPRPFLAFFQKLSEILPVFVYQFNPCREMWLDDEAFSKALRHNVGQKLADGELAPMGDDVSLEDCLADNSHPILGRLGIAAQGSLGYLLDQANGNVDQLMLPPPPRETLLHRFQSHILERRVDDDLTPPLSPDDLSIRIHAAHNPRRELEVIRDQIIDYLAQHTDCSPRDILVLLADWDSYSPFITSVFDTAYVAPSVGDTSGQASPRVLPIRIAGSREYEMPSAFRAFRLLLECLDNRLPVDKVVALMSEEAVGPHFGIQTKDIPALKKLLKKGNIVWGIDDDDIAKTLNHAFKKTGSREDSQIYTHVNTSKNIAPFSWRRGLDRLLLGQLLGENNEQQVAGLPYTISSPDAYRFHLLGEEPSFFSHPIFKSPILPCRLFGRDTLPLIGGLDSFLNSIKHLRTFFVAPDSLPPIKTLQTILLDAIDTFFDANQDPEPLSTIRQSIVMVLNRVAIAERMHRKPTPISLALIREALVDELASSTSTSHSSIGQDAVVFSPLRMENAFPARFVWICGLNSGSFPKQEQFFSFDLIARHRTFLDPTQHEKDSFALLEAILSARETLGFSFLGRNEKTNDPLPASPVLVNQIDYLNRHFFADSKIRIVEHRLQAFHPSYFSKEAANAAGYPVSHSKSDFKIALAVRAKTIGAHTIKHLNRTLTIPDEIDIEQLDEIFLNPNAALLQ